MAYDADIARARRLMPLVTEGFAASLTEAATRFAIPPGHGHDPGRDGDAAAVRGRARGRAEGAAAASGARPAHGTAAGLRGRDALTPRNFAVAVATHPRCNSTVEFAARVIMPGHGARRIDNMDSRWPGGMECRKGGQLIAVPLGYPQTP